MTAAENAARYLTSLPAGPYTLTRPVPVEAWEVRLTRGPTGVHVARWPDADLEGTAKTPAEALDRLGRQAAALYALVERRPDAQLGPTLPGLKRALALALARR